jgi:hypothetical protein
MVLIKSPVLPLESGTNIFSVLQGLGRYHENKCVRDFWYTLYNQSKKCNMDR